MRSLVNRKINRQPIRSPSPDIANRNIITHTAAPQMRQILSKSRSKLSEASKHNLPHNSGDIQNGLIQSHQRIRELERELTGLLIENSTLKKENAELKDIVAKNKPSFLRPFEQSQPDMNLREYQTRISRFSDQIKRIQELLRRQKQKNQQLISQNLKLKNYDPRYSGYQKNSYHEENLSNSLRYIENTLNDNFEKLKAEHQLKLHLSLHELNQRLLKIERNQYALQNLASKVEFQTPRAKKQHQKSDYSTGGYHSGSSQIKKFYRSNRHPEEERQIDMLKDKLRLNQFELQDARKEYEKLKTQMHREQDRTSVGGECPSCKLYLIRIAEYEKEIQNLRFLKGENQILQQRIEDLLRQNGELRNSKDGNSFYTNRIQILEKENQNLKLTKQQEHYQNQVKLRDDERKLSKNAYSLEEYLKRIKDLKIILSKEEFTDFLMKIKSLIQQNKGLQVKVARLEQNNKLNRQAKNRQIQLRIQVSELRRQSGVLKVEVKQMQEQITKLKEIINQHIKSQENERNGSINVSQCVQGVQPQTAKFQIKLSQAIQQLQIMQKQVNMML